MTSPDDQVADGRSAAEQAEHEWQSLRQQDSAMIASARSAALRHFIERHRANDDEQVAMLVARAAREWDEHSPAPPEYVRPDRVEAASYDVDADEAKDLVHRLRTGELDEASVRRAAMLGYPAATLALDLPTDPGLVRNVGLLHGLLRRGGPARGQDPWRRDVRRALALRVLYGWPEPLPIGDDTDRPRLRTAPRTDGNLDVIRSLEAALRQHDGDVSEAVLGPWVGKHADRELMPMPWRRRAEEQHILGPDGRLAAAWLSRVNDLLLMSFQSDGDHPWSGSRVSLGEYVRFWRRLGFAPDVSEAFHPFDHEIVEVDQSDDPSEPITLVDVLWPGLMWGRLRFSRAGVRVRGGRDHVVKQVAESSVLHYAHEPLRRPTGAHLAEIEFESFRRDYVEDDAYRFGVDAVDTIVEVVDEGELGAHAAIELVTNRCWVKTMGPDGAETAVDADARWVEFRPIRSE